MGAGLGMVRGHLGLGLRVGLLRPLAEDFLPELAQFCEDPLLGDMGIAPVGDGVIERVEKVMQTRPQLGPLGQTDFETAARGGQFYRWFIIHEHRY